jgi:hypothetical protein
MSKSNPLCKGLGSLLLLIALLGNSALASWHVRRASYQDIPTITPDVRKAWMAGIFESCSEFWLIRDKFTFLKLLTSLGVDPVLTERLMASSSEQLSREESNDLITFAIALDREARKNENYRLLRITPDIKEALKREAGALDGIYNYLVDTDGAPPHLSFPTATAYQVYLEYLKVPRGVEPPIVVQRKPGLPFFPKKRITVFFTPDNWLRLPDEMKADFIKINLTSGDTPGQRLYNEVSDVIGLEFTSCEDIPGIVEAYAMGRNGSEKRALARYLGCLMEKSPGRVGIRLQRIMPSRLRHILNTYTTCSGPNCLNFVMLTPGHIGKKYSGVDEIREFLASGFRSVKPEEPLRPGDIMVYENEKGEIVHAMYFLTEACDQSLLRTSDTVQLVLTKNGLTKFSPYAVQPRDRVEQVYVRRPDRGGYRLAVFRVDSDRMTENSKAEPVIYYRTERLDP